MHLYFQFLTQDQSPAAIDLIRLVGLFFSKDSLGGLANISSHGALTRQKFASLAKLVLNKGKSRFSELEVILDLKELKSATIDDEIEAINGVFKPSPTSALWLRASDWRTTVTRTTENRWSNARLQESRLAHLGVRSQPCIFEMVMSVRGSRSPESILSAIAKFIVREWPTEIARLKVFGCCDIGGTDLCVKTGAGALATQAISIIGNVHPVAYSYLGERFDGLHPIMFGPRRVCSGIARSLGKLGRFIPGVKGNDFAATRVDLKCDLHSNMLRAKRWLVAPDQNEAFKNAHQIMFVNGRLGILYRRSLLSGY